MVDGLILGLADILKAEFMKSDAARTAFALEASIGTSFSAAFDFDALSDVLSHGEADKVPLDGRQKRINWALDVLSVKQGRNPAKAFSVGSGIAQFSV